MDQIKILTHTWQEVCGNDHWAVLLITELRAGEVNRGGVQLSCYGIAHKILVWRSCHGFAQGWWSHKSARKEGPLMVGGECGQQLLQCVSNEEVGQEE